MRRLLILSGLSMALVWPAAVAAQDSDPTPNATPAAQTATQSHGRRQGLMLGFGTFAGNGLEANASVSAGMGVQVGWMMRPTVAILLDTHGAAVGSSDVTDSNVSASVRVRSLAAACVQWWPTTRFWIRGGVGPGRVEGVTESIDVVPSAEFNSTANGMGATIATGYELYRGALFSLDLDARYASIHASGSDYSTVVLGLGFMWYP